MMLPSNVQRGLDPWHVFSLDVSTCLCTGEYDYINAPGFACSALGILRRDIGAPAACSITP
jgi:hypothetical protein